MSIPATLKLLGNLQRAKTTAKPNRNDSSVQHSAGFTLIELLVVVVIIGVLATIMAPGWFGFVNQRRASAANDVVLGALRDAQSQAKSKKLKYSVSFRNTADKIPQVAVYPDTATSLDNYWKNLGGELNLKPNQIIFGDNLPNKITFDQFGSLVLPTPQPTLPLVVKLGSPGGSSNTLTPTTKRCVKIQTLLGSITTGKKDECN